jgi:hypothetical protein
MSNATYKGERIKWVGKRGRGREGHGATATQSSTQEEYGGIPTTVPCTQQYTM